MADAGDREIREACGLEHSVAGRSHPPSRQDLADALCALRRVLQRDRGGMPEVPGAMLDAWNDYANEQGIPVGSAIRIDMAQGFEAGWKAAVAAARQQP